MWRMAETQLVSRGISDKRALEVMSIILPTRL